MYPARQHKIGLQIGIKFSQRQKLFDKCIFRAEAAQMRCAILIESVNNDRLAAFEKADGRAMRGPQLFELHLAICRLKANVAQRRDGRFGIKSLTGKFRKVAHRT